MDIPLDELYQEIILEHYRRPRNHQTGALPPGIAVQAENPSCGDELTLSLQLDADGEHVSGVSWQGHGCSISQASASMMSEAVAGLSLAQTCGMIDQVRGMMHGEPAADELEDVLAFKGVSQLPMRVKCVLLAWLALGDAVNQAKAAGPDKATAAQAASVGGAP